MNNDVELIPVKGVLPSVQVQSDNVIYVPQAHKNKAGIVKEGDGVLIENGVVSLNRQTVEDMIDANKWVSYGFKQNLTEDEKGMARHNIGAGDNYFTGSYYDLTQKPHLNTNNTAGLDYGDEELNDTINLHKISKTGSFNDLKHVPQETLDFAESERQKSKNLLNFTRPAITSNVKAYNDHIIINGTVEGYVYPYYSSNLPQGVQLKQGKTYTFSRTLLSGTGNKSFKIELSLRNINDTQIQSVTIPDGEDSVTFTIESNDIAMYACSLSFTSSATFTDAYYGLQLEKGSVATGYQPYNGPITHNGDAPVVFAEKEREKSKNLFDYTKIKSLNYGITQADGIFTINTQFYYPAINYDINLNQGVTYTFSLNIDSYSNSDGSGVNSEIVLFNADGDTDTKGVGGVNSTGRYSMTFTPVFDVVSVEIRPIRKNNNTSTLTGTVSKLMLCVGEDSEYQPYNGAIVHEKEIADVEHIETIYDVTNTSLNMGYSGGINGDLGTDIPYDFTKYKKVIATCCTEDIDANQYSSMFSFELDLFKKTTNTTNPYRAIATVLNPYVVMSTNSNTQLVCALFEIGYNKTYFTYKAYLKNGENPAALLSNAKLIKLEGVY